MKLKQILEARYHGTHRWISNFIQHVWDPDCKSQHNIPDDVDIKDVQTSFIDAFGEPEADGQESTQWSVRIPEDVMSADKLHDNELAGDCVIDLVKHNRRVYIGWY